MTRQLLSNSGATSYCHHLLLRHPLSGGARLREIREVLGPNFEAEGFDTVGGLVLGLLGRPPKVGDEVWAGDRLLSVEVVDELRVGRVTLGEGNGENGSETRSGGNRKIFVRPGGPDEHHSVLEKVESFLEENPNSEVELVLAGEQSGPFRANLLGFLAGRGLSVSICGSTLKVRRPTRGVKLRAFPIRSNGRSTQGG